MIENSVETDNFLSPTSVDKVLKYLYQFGDNCTCIAGGTWIMRSKIRHQKVPDIFISLQNVKELKNIEIDSNRIVFGAMCSHFEIADKLRNIKELSAVYTAAKKSANPAIRRMATIGGNICSKFFESSDLLPALIACDATVNIQTLTDSFDMPILEFFYRREKVSTPHILCKVLIPRGKFFTSHQRVLIRNAGEYPIANLSVKLTEENKIIKKIQLVVGSVEEKAKKWSSLGSELKDRELKPKKIQELSKSFIDFFSGRDSVDAPGWYRKRVLSRMVHDAICEINIAIDKESESN